MSQLFVKSEEDAHLRAVFLVKRLELLLRFRIARTQQNKLDVELHQLIHRLKDQVEAFLFHESRNRTYERNRIVVRQVEPLREGFLVVALGLDGFQIILPVDMVIG